MDFDCMNIYFGGNRLLQKVCNNRLVIFQLGCNLVRARRKTTFKLNFCSSSLLAVLLAWPR